MRKSQREWRAKKRKNWSEQQTQNCTLSRSKAFALTYQCISQRWSMWFVDNLSKIIFSEDNLLYEKIYQMLIRFYIDRVQNMQSLVLQTSPLWSRGSLISSQQSPCRGDICHCRWQCKLIQKTTYFLAWLNWLIYLCFFLSKTGEFLLFSSFLSEKGPTCWC